MEAFKKFPWNRESKSQETCYDVLGNDKGSKGQIWFVSLIYIFSISFVIMKEFSWKLFYKKIWFLLK